MTKADAVDEETLELALEEARELVPGRGGRRRQREDGQRARRAARGARRAADRVPTRAQRRPARLFVDRVFTLRGIGTVATGTLWSGAIGEGDELRAEPGGLPVRVRSVQVHDRPVERAEAGQRVAVSLPGVERAASSTAARRWSRRAPTRSSYRLDVALEELQPIKDGARLHVHHGTAEIPAVVRRIGERLRPAPARARRSSRRAATGSCSAARRPSAAGSCSTPRRRGTRAPSGSS